MMLFGPGVIEPAIANSVNGTRNSFILSVRHGDGEPPPGSEREGIILQFPNFEVEGPAPVFARHAIEMELRLLAMRMLRPGGRMVATSWDQPAKAPFAGLVAEALALELPDDRADLLRPFSLADPAANVALYEAAGFGDINVELVQLCSRFTSFEDDFWEPIEAGGGRLGQAYLGLPDQAQRAVRERVLSQLPVRSARDPIALQHSAWILAARVPQACA